ncbi:unnamed protein product [Closterium sp. NIES-54]
MTLTQVVPYASCHANTCSANAGGMGNPPFSLTHPPARGFFKQGDLSTCSFHYLNRLKRPHLPSALSTTPRPLSPPLRPPHLPYHPASLPFSLSHPPTSMSQLVRLFMRPSHKLLLTPPPQPPQVQPRAQLPQQLPHALVLGDLEASGREEGGARGERGAVIQGSLGEEQPCAQLSQ